MTKTIQLQPDPLRCLQERLAVLDQSVDAMAGQLGSARAARPANRETLIASLDVVLEAARIVQKTLAELAAAVIEPPPEWGTREELDAAVTRLAARAEERSVNRWRQRLQEIATSLFDGHVVSRRTRRVIASLDNLRGLAAAELVRVAEGDHPLVLPGPPDGPWLDWVFEQPGNELEFILAPLHGLTPELYRFLLDLHPDDWQASPATSSSVILHTSLNSPTPSSPSPTLVVSPPSAALTASPRVAPLNPAPVATNFSPAAIVPESASLPVDGQSRLSQPPLVQPHKSAHDQEPPPAVPVQRPESAHRPPVARSPTPTSDLPAQAGVADVPKPAPAQHLADVQEILARCVAGDYLRAALLAAGRAFGGLPEIDPSFEVLLIAHQVGSASAVHHWPEWCYNLEAVASVAHAAPNSARLIFLAAQCQVARGEGVTDPLPEEVGVALLDVFNDLPEVRKWFAAFRDATSVPGLWEQVCRPAPPDRAAEYREHRRTFAERYDGGLLHRSDKAAYIRRQDHYLSRQPAFRLLYEHLQPGGPVPVTVDEKITIESWLGKKPEWVTDAWHESTERVSGRVKLHGNQRAELVRRAAEYLDYANRAWRAARALGSVSVTLKNVERLQKELRDLLPTTLDLAKGQPWEVLFRQLAGRLPS